MTKSTHPALEALRKIHALVGVPDVPGQSQELSCVLAMREIAREAIPALKALLAERDELRAALEAVLPLACESYTEGTRQIREARAALAKHGGQP